MVIVAIFAYILVPIVINDIKRDRIQQYFGVPVPLGSFSEEETLIVRLIVRPVVDSVLLHLHSRFRRAAETSDSLLIFYRSSPQTNAESVTVRLELLRKAGDEVRVAEDMSLTAQNLAKRFGFLREKDAEKY